MSWRQKHANEAEKALKHELVEDVMKEFAENLQRNPDVAREGWDSAQFRYGMMKIGAYVAQVARAEALGFDPELLRPSSEEADEQMLRKAQMAVEAGKPVWVIFPEKGGDGS